MPNELGRLRAEAATFGAYFGCTRLPADVVARYELALASAQPDARDRFDDWLLAFARRHHVFTGLADAYARFARPYGQLRHRLTLMLALLETHGATHAAYDRAKPSSAVFAWLALGANAFGWGLRSLVALLICGPAQLLMSRTAPAGR